MACDAWHALAMVSMACTCYLSDAYHTIYLSHPLGDRCVTGRLYHKQVLLQYLEEPVLASLFNKEQTCVEVMRASPVHRSPAQSPVRPSANAPPRVWYLPVCLFVCLSFLSVYLLVCLFHQCDTSCIRYKPIQGAAACVRTCMHTCMRVCVHVCVCACVCMCGKHVDRHVVVKFVGLFALQHGSGLWCRVLQEGFRVYCTLLHIARPSDR